MKKITDRLNSPTPKFWGRVRDYAILIGSVATILLTLPLSAPVLGVVTIVSTFAIAIAAGSQTLTKKHLRKMTKEEILSIEMKLLAVENPNEVQLENIEMIKKFNS